MTNVNPLYMRRCLQLAAMATGHTSPNPMVGAVVVYNNRIIGEGYHHRCGEPHAEVNAIASVQDKSLLAQSTIYVSLEPCSHYGKTPPCCELIIASGIPRVVVGCLDPFPQVSGRGVARLRECGIDVVVGCLEKECLALNRHFITSQTKGRPYITLKWAQSADGYIDRQRSTDEPATRLSNDITRTWAHRLRATHDAILVGTNTAITDNPSLTTRHWSGHNPLRITIDRNGRIPAHASLFDGSTPTLVLGKNGTTTNAEFIPLQPDTDPINTLLDILSQRNIQSILIEGGSTILQAFIDADLWDEAHIETAPINLYSGVKAPSIHKYKKVQINTYNHRHYTHIVSHQ